MVFTNLTRYSHFDAWCLANAEMCMTRALELVMEHSTTPPYYVIGCNIDSYLIISIVDKDRVEKLLNSFSELNGIPRLELENSKWILESIPRAAYDHLVSSGDDLPSPGNSLMVSASMVTDSGKFSIHSSITSVHDDQIFPISLN